METKKNQTHKEKYGAKEFIPIVHNPLPWKVLKSPIWNGIVCANGKRVCNCRNIKDAELIVEMVNKMQNLESKKMTKKQFLIHYNGLIENVGEDFALRIYYLYLDNDISKIFWFDISIYGNGDITGPLVYNNYDEAIKHIMNDLDDFKNYTVVHTLQVDNVHPKISIEKYYEGIAGIWHNSYIRKNEQEIENISNRYAKSIIKKWFDLNKDEIPKDVVRFVREDGGFRVFISVDDEEQKVQFCHNYGYNNTFEYLMSYDDKNIYLNCDSPKAIEDLFEDTDEGYSFEGVELNSKHQLIAKFTVDNAQEENA